MIQDHHQDPTLILILTLELRRGLTCKVPRQQG
jgi:hypothetical protein